MAEAFDLGGRAGSPHVVEDVGRAANGAGAVPLMAVKVARSFEQIGQRLSAPGIRLSDRIRSLQGQLERGGVSTDVIQVEQRHCGKLLECSMFHSRTAAAGRELFDGSEVPGAAGGESGESPPGSFVVDAREHASEPIRLGSCRLRGVFELLASPAQTLLGVHPFLQAQHRGNGVVET